MKTIKDIAAEMREFADAESQSIGRDVLRRRIQHFADRIEADWEIQLAAQKARAAGEGYAAGKQSVTKCNQLEMREALEWFWGKRSMLDFCHNNLSAKTWEDWDKVYCFLREFADKVQATLSASPRNCDRFNDPGEALSAYCEAKGITHPLPLWFGNEFWCFLQWLFAKADGDAK